MNDIMLINDAIKKHGELLEYYDAMGCKDDVLVQERYIGWLSELREYKEKERQVDAEPVKHGKWIWDSNAPQREHGAYKCSNCGCHSVFEENYCYDCGAKMDLMDGESE